MIRVKTPIAIISSASVNPRASPPEWTGCAFGDEFSLICIIEAPIRFFRFACVFIKSSLLRMALTGMSRLLICHYLVQVDEFRRFSVRWVLAFHPHCDRQPSVGGVRFAARHDRPTPGVRDSIIAKRITWGYRSIRPASF